jgi:16S rRNA (uracil1498-N3)-methyltransferase
MQLFYIDPSLSTGSNIILPEESSRHIVAVLRMKVGDELQLTNGEGSIMNAVIEDAHKKNCRVRVTVSKQFERPAHQLIMAVSLLKNTGRFEWFLEKATEIGVTQIIPLQCARTEKQQFRFDRMHTILESAMMQSNQVWLPVLEQPTPFSKVFDTNYYKQAELRLVAHCMEEEKTDLPLILKGAPLSRMIFIGPEGDFTAEEITIAREHEAIPVSLGDTRLRTETACIVAAALMKNIK